MNHFKFGIIPLIFVLSFHAQAKYLTIQGRFVSVQTRIDADAVNFHAVYKIQNSGDEAAADVFPTLEIGAYKWGGVPTSIASSASYTWNLDLNIPISELNSGDSHSFPKVGLQPVMVRRHYRDMNGYAFSAVDVIPIQLGELTDSQSLSTRVPRLDMSVHFNGNGQVFEGELKLRNTSDQQTRVWMKSHLPRELQITDLPPVVDLAPKEKKEIKLSLSNDTGLIGSSYALWIVAQWEESGIRNFISANEVVKIEEPNHLPGLIIGISILVLLMSAIAYFKLRT